MVTSEGIGVTPFTNDRPAIFIVLGGEFLERVVPKNSSLVRKVRSGNSRSHSRTCHRPAHRAEGADATIRKGAVAANWLPSTSSSHRAGSEKLASAKETANSARVACRWCAMRNTQSYKGRNIGRAAFDAEMPVLYGPRRDFNPMAAGGYAATDPVPGAVSGLREAIRLAAARPAT